MEKYFTVLRKCLLFSQIQDGDLLALLGCLGAKVRQVQKRETVVAEGETLREIGIVLTGAVQIIQVDYFGNRSILSDVGPSELFGEAFACAGEGEIPVSIVATEDSELLFVDCNRVLHACCNACAFHAQIIFNLMKNMAQKNIRFHQKLQITAKRTTREKLLTYLTLEAKKQGSNSFTVPFDRQELADYLEVDRSGLSNEISKLRDEGVLTSQKSKFTLLQ